MNDSKTDFLPYNEVSKEESITKWCVFPTEKCGEYLNVAFHLLDDPHREVEEKEDLWMVSVMAETKNKKLLLLFNAVSLEDDTIWLGAAPTDKPEHLICKAEAKSVTTRTSYLEITKEKNKTHLLINKYNEASGEFESVSLKDVRPNRNGDSFEEFVRKSCQELIEHGNATYGHIDNDEPQR